MKTLYSLILVFYPTGDVQIIEEGLYWDDCAPRAVELQDHAYLKGVDLSAQDFKCLATGTEVTLDLRPQEPPKPRTPFVVPKAKARDI